MAREQLVQRHTLLLQRACVLAAARALALVELAYMVQERDTDRCVPPLQVHLATTPFLI
jgi:hypothetical protein